MKPSRTVALWVATHFEARLWYVRWSLFSITLLNLMAWLGHARALMVNVSRWGIVDLPPQRHSWGITPPLLPQRLLPHLTTQTRLTHSQLDCINRCFHGEAWKPPHWDQIGVGLVCVRRSTCVYVYAAMLCFCNILCMYLDYTWLLGKVNLFFFVPMGCLFLHSVSNFSSFLELF